MYFTADLHYGHDNIVKHCRRPALSPEERRRLDAGEDFRVSAGTRQAHHDWLVDGVNSAVGRNDVLWVLGDCVARRDAEEFRSRVRCKDLRLVRGNHDAPHTESIFTQVHDLFNLFWGGKWLVLCHYPMKSWYKSHRGSYQLHGHCHGNLPPHDDLQMDVGVDVLGRPVSVDEVLSAMREREERRAARAVSRDVH